MVAAPADRLWNREQQLVAFWLYCTEPFGRLHKHNPLIVRTASQIGRTPSALAMKACNFASLDPVFVASGRVGLTAVSNADRALWAEFTTDSDRVVVEASIEWERVQRGDGTDTDIAVFAQPEGPSEVMREVNVRRVQGFFRSAVLAAYESQCAVTGLAVPELLVASHIIPWAVADRRRADPTNGLLLNALLDRAFDRHLISFDDNLRLMCAPRLHRERPGAKAILEFEGAILRLPRRFSPDPAALADHRALLAA